jgi:Peptidase family S49
MLDRLESDRIDARRARRDRAALLAKPRLFRPRSDYLAIEPQALEFSYLYTGVVPNDRTEDGIAIVTVHGPLEHHATYWWDSYEAIVERVEDAMTGCDLVKYDEWRNGWQDDYEPISAMPARAVVLCIDSPGGEAAGCGQAHKRLRSLRKQYNVPLYAFADETMCSAAYEIGCACDEIWMPETGTVGSIGVIGTLFDRTKMNEKEGLRVELITSGEYKADGHADREIDDGVRGRMQARVDSLAGIFWRIVAKRRGASPKAVAGLKAGVFLGQEAVDVGIADGVAGWRSFLRMVARSLDEVDVDVAAEPSAA